MKYLIGQSFSLAEGSYRIVDVRNVGGQSMVFAEKLIEARDFHRRLLRKAAFHYRDIAGFIENATAS